MLSSTRRDCSQQRPSRFKVMSRGGLGGGRWTSCGREIGVRWEYHSYGALPGRWLHKDRHVTKQNLRVMLPAPHSVSSCTPFANLSPTLCDCSTSPHDLIPASIHHEYDSSLGRWSRRPNCLGNGSNSLWEIVFVMNTRRGSMGTNRPTSALRFTLTASTLGGVRPGEHEV